MGLSLEYSPTQFVPLPGEDCITTSQPTSGYVGCLLEPYTIPNGWCSQTVEGGFGQAVDAATAFVTDSPAPHV